MTDEPNSISRRNVLAGLGTIGVGGALVGAGTSAFFSDSEHFDGNELVAGELELKLDWQQFYYGAPQDERPQDYGEAGRPYVNAHPDHNDNGEQSIEVDGETYKYSDNDRNLGDDEIDYCENLDDDYYFGEDQDSLIELDDVKPGDCGEITFSYHLCDNPGWVWLRTKNKGYQDGKYDETHLADEIDAVLWYDLNANNELDDGEPIIVDGTLRDVLDKLNDGVLLDETFSDIDPPENEKGAACVPLSKVEDGNVGEFVDREGVQDIDDLKDGDVLTFEDEGRTVEITLETVQTKDDGEVTGFDWTSSKGICRVEIKGGPRTNISEYDCEDSGKDTAPDTPAGPQAGVSNFTFYYCPDDVPPKPECVPNSTTQYIALEWCLPEDVGNEVQGDSVNFDLQFYTEQCRHNENPEPDWPNYDD